MVLVHDGIDDKLYIIFWEKVAVVAIHNGEQLKSNPKWYTMGM